MNPKMPKIMKQIPPAVIPGPPLVTVAKRI
jgi:hypothetical protein